MKIDLDNLLKQTQDMQSKMQTVQEDLTKIEVQGEAGGGLVRVKMDGRHVIKDTYIDVSLLTEDKAVLEELLTGAFNSALEKAETEVREKLTKLYAAQIQTKFNDIQIEE